MKAAILALLIATPASATTLALYTPGGSPCDGACTYDWALDQSGVPAGEPVRMVIPEGTIVEGMSYAREGEPYWMPYSAILAQDEYGEGYYFERDGQTLMMVKLDSCQNWAVMRPAPASINYATSTQRVTAQRTATFERSYDVFTFTTPERVPEHPYVPDDPHVPAIPLPEPIGLLLGALSILALAAIYRNMDALEEIR